VTERTYQMGEGQMVTLIVATDDVPLQVDIAITARELDPEDPRRPGDIIWHDGGDADRVAFINRLVVVAGVLHDAEEG
jgi:hypothetical protein